MDIMKFVKVKVGLDYNYIPLVEVRDRNGAFMGTKIENGGRDKQLLTLEELQSDCKNRCLGHAFDIIKGIEEAKDVETLVRENTPVMAHFDVYGKPQSIPVLSEGVLLAIINTPHYEELMFS